MANFCNNCGKQLRDGAKFCNECGARIRQSVAHPAPQPQAQPPVHQPGQQWPAQRQQPVQQPQPAQPQRSAKKKISSRALISILLVIALLAEIAVAGFRYPGFFRSGGKKKANTLVDSQSAVLSLAQPSATLCGVTLEADSYNLKGGDLQAVVEDHGTGVAENGAAYHEYDIRLGDQSEYTAATALTFPCDGNPEDYVILHKDHETGGWMPMIGFEDPAAGTITVYTDGFSEFRQQLKLDSALFMILNDGKPNATVVVNPGYLDVIKQMDKSTYDKTMNSFTADPLKFEEAQTQGGSDSKLKEFFINAMGPLTEVVGGAANLNATPVEIMMNNSIYVYSGADMQADLSTLSNGYTILSMGIQVAKDVKNEGLRSNKTAGNLIKSLCTNGGTLYSMATGYSSTAFTFTFFGVAMLGMELDALTESAQGEQEAYMTKLMNYYFNDVKPFDENEWYEAYNRLVHDRQRTVKDATAELQQMLDDHANEFWTVMEKQSGPEFDALMLEAGIKNIYSISAEKKAQLTAAVKNTLRQKFNDLVLPKIEKDVTCSQQATLYKMLQDFANKFNRQIYFVITERVDMQTVTQTNYNGCVLAFGSTDKNFVIKDEDWLLDTPPRSGDDEWDDGWELSFSATDIAWMRAGMPDTLFVFESRDKMGEDAILEPHFQQPHNQPGRKAYINLSGSQTYAWRMIDISINPNYPAGSADRVFDWSGTIEELHVFWQENVDGEIKKYDDITCSTGATADFPVEVQFSCFYDGAVKNPSARSQTSSASIDAGGTFPSQGYYPDGRNGTLFEGESVVPEAAEGKTFSVTINRGLYSLVYRYEAVPVEEKNDYDPVIINNCDTGSDIEPFLGTWLMTNDDGSYVSGAAQIPLIITETTLTTPNWGLNEFTVVSYTVAGKTLTITTKDDNSGESGSLSFTLLDDTHLFVGTEYSADKRIFVRQ